jgi:acyl-CoA thioesterase I
LVWIAALWLGVCMSATALAQPPRPTILIVGDSLSAEYGLPRDTGWVSLLARQLAQQGSPLKGGTAAKRAQYIVVNASISGETTSGGRTRLPALLQQHRPAVVVLQLGANDGLRGLPLTAMRDNLRAMIDSSKAAGARVLLVGMRIPPNFGRDYTERFFETFAQLAREQKTGHVPFLLDGFADDLTLFQPDRIHPNGRAQQRMLDNVWPALRPLLG